MFSFTDDERSRLTDLYAISTDSHGQEVLVGLSIEETEFCMARRRRFMTANRDHDRESKSKFVDLMKRHEAARLSVLGAAVQLRNENPPRH